MADFAFTQFAVDLGGANADWDGASYDLRTALFYTGTNVETLRDQVDLSTPTTVTNEYDATGYTAYDHTAGTVTRDDANNLAKLGGIDNATWTITATGSGNVVSAVVLHFVTSVSGSVPLVHFNVSYTDAVGTFTIQWHTDGVCKITT